MSQPLRIGSIAVGGSPFANLIALATFGTMMTLFALMFTDHPPPNGLVILSTIGSAICCFCALIWTAPESGESRPLSDTRDQLQAFGLLISIVVLLLLVVSGLWSQFSWIL